MQVECRKQCTNHFAWNWIQPNERNVRSSMPLQRLGWPIPHGRCWTNNSCFLVRIIVSPFRRRCITSAVFIGGLDFALPSCVLFRFRGRLNPPGMCLFLLLDCPFGLFLSNNQPPEGWPLWVEVWSAMGKKTLMTDFHSITHIPAGPRLTFNLMVLSISLCYSPEVVEFIVLKSKFSTWSNCRPEESRGRCTFFCFFLPYPSIHRSLPFGNWSCPMSFG